MADKKPTEAETVLSHLLVSSAVALAGARLNGLPGALIGALLGYALHQALDAPLAGVIAELT
jgi:hypothetical protein